LTVVEVVLKHEKVVLGVVIDVVIAGDVNLFPSALVKLVPGLNRCCCHRCKINDVKDIVS
jgi:hypothetical protein